MLTKFVWVLDFPSSVFTLTSFHVAVLHKYSRNETFSSTPMLFNIHLCVSWLWVQLFLRGGVNQWPLPAANKSTLWLGKYQLGRSSAVVRRWRWFNDGGDQQHSLPCRPNQSFNQSRLVAWINTAVFNLTRIHISRLSKTQFSVHLQLNVGNTLAHTHSAAPSTCTTHVNSCRWGIIGDEFIAPAFSFSTFFKRRRTTRFSQICSIRLLSNVSRNLTHDDEFWVHFFSFWYDFDTQSHDQ